MDVFLERKLDAESRNKMKDSTFGLPEERKYPLNDASHVKSAIAFFKYCPADKKHSLAKKIISAAKRFGVKISEDSRVWKIAHEAVMFEDEYDESNGIVLQEADKKKDDNLDEEINDDITEEEDVDTDPIDYTDDIDSDEDSDPMDYTTDDSGDEEDIDPIDYTQDDNTEDDTPTTMADDDEPTDYTQDIDSGEDTSDDAPQDYTQDINTDDSDPNNDNSNVKPEEPTLGGNTDNNNDNSQAQLSPDEGGDDDTEPTDYTQDIDSGDGVDGNEGNPDDGSDTPPDDGTDAGMQPSGGTELQNMQNDVFSNLSPEQMKIKIANIKQSFIDLYNDVVEILERLSTVNKSSNNLESINFATVTLNELKSMLNDHLVSTFETKSLVENQITLQRFLAIYAMVIKILEKVSNKQENSDKK